MKTKIPKLKVAASNGDGDKKKKGLAGTLSNLQNLVTGLGSGGANAAGGLFGGLNSGLSALLATKFGIAGLIAFGTLAAGGIGLVATREWGAGQAPSGPVTGDFFDKSTESDKPAPEPLTADRKDSTDMMKQAAKGDIYSYSKDYWDEQQKAKDEKAAKEAAAVKAKADAEAEAAAKKKAADEQIAAKTRQDAVVTQAQSSASADPFAGRKLGGGGGMAGGIGGSFAALGGGGGGGGRGGGGGMELSGSPGGLTKGMANGPQVGMAQTQAAPPLASLRSSGRGGSGAKNALMAASNLGKQAMASHSIEGASYKAAGAFDGNAGAAGGAGGGGGIGSGPGADANPSLNPTAGGGSQYTPPAPGAQSTGNPWDSLMGPILGCMLGGMAMAMIAGLVAKGGGVAPLIAKIMAVIAIAAAITMVGLVIAALKKGMPWVQSIPFFFAAIMIIITAIGAYSSANGQQEINDKFTAAQQNPNGLNQINTPNGPVQGNFSQDGTQFYGNNGQTYGVQSGSTQAFSQGGSGTLQATATADPNVPVQPTAPGTPGAPPPAAPPTPPPTPGTQQVATGPAAPTTTTAPTAPTTTTTQQTVTTTTTTNPTTGQQTQQVTTTTTGPAGSTPPGAPTTTTTTSSQPAPGSFAASQSTSSNQWTNVQGTGQGPNAMQQIGQSMQQMSGPMQQAMQQMAGQQGQGGQPPGGAKPPGGGQPPQAPQQSAQQSQAAAGGSGQSQPGGPDPTQQAPTQGGTNAPAAQPDNSLVSGDDAHASAPGATTSTPSSLASNGAAGGGAGGVTDSAGQHWDTMQSQTGTTWVRRDAGGAILESRDTPPDGVKA